MLNPKIFLRNAGPSTAMVSPGVNWLNASNSGTSPLPRITLLPGQMRILNLADFQKTRQIPAEALWATVTLGFTGRSGDLVAVAMSYDKTSRYGLQTPFTEGTNHLFKGSMWHVDGTHNTIITTGNGGTEPTRAQVTLFYNGGQSKYRVEKSLSPGQQIWLNVGDLLRNQVPDSDGKTVPPDVMSGSYELRDLDHEVLGLLYEGKLVVDKTYGHASYGCGHCCGYSSGRLFLTPFGGPPNIDKQNTYQAYNACTSRYDDFDYAFSPYSSNTGVATLSAGLSLHTVAVGGATTSGKNTVPYGISGGCPNVDMPDDQGVSVKPTVTVSGPTNIPMLKTGTTGPDSITVTATGNPTGGTYSWAALSGGPNIKILNATSQSAILQSVAVGTYTVQVTYTLNNQPGTATTVGKVQQPGSLAVITNTTPQWTCSNLPGSYITEERLIQYQVLDTSAVPIPVTGMN